MRVVRVPVGKSKRRNGGHAVRAPCAAFGRAALKSSDFDASIVLVVADQAVLGLCSEPRSSGGLVRSGEAKYRGAWHAGARAPGLRCGGCRGVFRGGRSSCHGPDRRTSRASGRKGNIVSGGDQRAGSLVLVASNNQDFVIFFSEATITNRTQISDTRHTKEHNPKCLTLQVSTQ